MQQAADMGIAPLKIENGWNHAIILDSKSLVVIQFRQEQESFTSGARKLD